MPYKIIVKKSDPATLRLGFAAGVVMKRQVNYLKADGANGRSTASIA